MVDKRISIIDHLEELRRAIIKSVIAISVAASVCYAYWKPIFEIVKKPLGKGQEIYVTSVMESFVGRFRIAIFAGLFLAFPVVLYQILSFIAPALKSKEKKFLYPILGMLVILFVCGVVFSYYIILPVGMEWLIGQGQGKLSLLITFDKYIAFVSLFLLAFGVGFETPVVILLLVKLGVVTPQTLRKNWRVAYIVILFIAAIITPDWSPITMGLMALPMLGLYELSIVLAKIF